MKIDSPSDLSSDDDSIDNESEDSDINYSNETRWTSKNRTNTQTDSPKRNLASKKGGSNKQNKKSKTNDNIDDRKDNDDNENENNNDNNNDNNDDDLKVIPSKYGISDPTFPLEDGQYVIWRPLI